jgi:AraC-like DNA-binding protein
MPGSRASVFGEPEDFQAALSADGVAGVLFTGRGQFRARLTQVGLERLQLAAVEEAQSRIAFIAMPADMVLVSFPIDGGPSPVWGGIEIRTGEMITVGPGERLHARTLGPCHWGAIRVPDRQLADYARALNGTGFVVPPAARWRPPRAAVRQLRHLHRAAIRMAEARVGALTDLQAAHGLEQQLLHSLIECLSAGLAGEETPTARRHRDILARFEDLLVAEPSLRMADICAALRVSERTLRECCKKQLGMGPSSYRRLRGMQQVHRALRGRNLDTASVSGVAGQYGFRDLGRLAANYRALYGELPSATLRKGLGQEPIRLTLRGRRGRV